MDDPKLLLLFLDAMVLSDWLLAVGVVDRRHFIDEDVKRAVKSCHSHSSYLKADKKYSNFVVMPVVVDIFSSWQSVRSLFYVLVGEGLQDVVLVIILVWVDNILRHAW